ncbi:MULTISPECIES: hypothetical protein [Enterobacter]|uniref:hypothetical protein n=1 Tax=Enterobacter TaxID=547 RepID=UPI000A3DF50C|nr:MULTISPECIES: hypothetical protein [Enterobacter]MCE1211533.1 hypothetical protein [Enterobacter hormaechei]MCW4762881.1 hypothetical protein [Enterobacter hormaechei subsp. xiangfangensis]MDI5880289.1 hypothetical protein [Enterobacter sp. EC-ML559]MDX7380774.1 hypothetical protein [Enterobacter hormaechei]
MEKFHIGSLILAVKYPQLMIAALGSGHWSKLDSGKLWSADRVLNPDESPNDFYQNH